MVQSSCDSPVQTLHSAVSQGHTFHNVRCFFLYKSIQCLSNGLKNYKKKFQTTVIKAKLSLCVHETNKETCGGSLISQSVNKPPMQKPCNWVCADQTVSNHQRANNKLLFSEGQQSRQHHQLDSRVCVVFLSTDRELSESDSLLCLVPYLQTWLHTLL